MHRQLAVDVARRFNGEVVNCDVMQMYDGLPIITNKVTPVEQRGVSHHLLGVVGLREQPWTVANFVLRASEVIAGIHKRGRLPVLVGGTHYYLQSLLFKSTVAAASDEKRASDAERDVEKHDDPRWAILDASPAEMMAELKKIDPVMASRWHPNDARKIRRSLEIYLQTGRKASEIYAEQQSHKIGALAQGDNITQDDGRPSQHGELVYPSLMLWTHTSRELLSSRLDARVDKMLESGLMQEVAELNSTRDAIEADGVDVDATRGIWVSIGYKEFEQYSAAKMYGSVDDKGLERLKQDAVERVKISTRQYAKNQIKWIRIKLANALRDGGADKALYLVETDELSSWDDKIMPAAAELVSSFLYGGQMPMPENTSETAKALLSPKQDYDLGRRPDLWVSKTCEICNVTATTESLWQQHINGRAHKGALRRLKKQNALPEP